MLKTFAKNKVTLSFILLMLGLAIYFSYLEDYNRKAIENWSKQNKIILTMENTSLHDFKVEFNQTEWNILQSKLKNVRHFKALDEKHMKRNEIGFDPEYAAEMVTYWKNEFNWTKHIESINKFPQYKIKINNEITLHFVRTVTNKNNETKTTIKLLLVNGWPDVFYHFNKMIDYIALNSNVSFDIIVPSIPGFGLSTPLYKSIDSVETAQYFDALLRFVNNDENTEYFVHGIFFNFFYPHVSPTSLPFQYFF